MQQSREMSGRFRVWDLPTRLFHWSLFVLIVAAIVSGKTGGNLMQWHGRIGLCIIGLIAFRIVWGFVGSSYARFAQFFPTPRALAAYLRGEHRAAGHNPLGALSVFAFLLLIAALAISGSFANDDITFRGPLFSLIDKTLSDSITGLHKKLTHLLIIMIALHLAAIAWYARRQRRNLVRPMLTGWQEGDAASAKGGGVVAFILALAIALGAVYLASGVWIELPPPPPPPAW